MTKSLPRDAERRLLDYAHTAAYLGISLRSAKELARNDKFPKVQIGHRVLFDKADLDAYIERVKRGAA